MYHRIYARIFALATILVAVSAFCGWLMGWTWLTNLAPNHVAMNPWTSIGLYLCGAGILTVTCRLRHVPVLLGSVVAALGSVRLVEYAAGTAKSFDQSILTDRLRAATDVVSSSMAQSSALCFLFMGLALAASGATNRRLRFAASGCELAVAFLALLGCLQFFFNTDSTLAASFYHPMAINTAIAFLIAVTGLALARHDDPVLELLRQPGPAGALTRRLLAAAVLVPVATSALVLAGFHAGWFDDAFQDSLDTALSVATFAAAVTWAASRARRSAAELEEIRSRSEALVLDSKGEAVDALTKLEANTRLLRQVLENMTEGIIVADPQGRFMHFNAAADAIFGLSAMQSNPEAWSRDFGLFHSDALTLFASQDLPLSRAIRGEICAEIEMYVKNPNSPDGLYLLANSQPIREPDGTISGGVVVFRDVTATRESRIQVLASLHDKEVLLREIHHRVKNNLAIVSSLLNLAADKSPGGPEGEALRDSQQRIQAMATIHETIYRGVDVGRFDVDDYLRRLLEDLQNSYGSRAALIRMEHRTQDVRLSLDAAVPCGLIVVELVSNAIKHAFPDSRAGRILVELILLAPNHALLRISDNGVGMPAVTRAGSLGLELVTGLTRQLDGILTRVPVDVGTVVEIEFPLEHEPVGSAA